MFVSELLSYSIFFQLMTYGDTRPEDPTPFMNHLDYSIFLALTSLILLTKFYTSSIIKEKFFYFFYFLFVTSSLFLNGGRTGQVAFIISLSISIFINVKNKLQAFFVLLFTLISILYIAYQISPIFHNRVHNAIVELNNLENNNINRYQGSIGSRIGLWIISYDLILDNPILGVGVKSAQAVIKNKLEYANSDFKKISVTSTHNAYLEFLITYGIIGLIFYLSIWYYLFKLNIQNTYFATLKIIFMSIYCIGSLFEILFYNQFSLSLFTLFLGIFIAINIDENNKIKYTITLRK